MKRILCTTLILVVVLSVLLLTACQSNNVLNPTQAPTAASTHEQAAQTSEPEDMAPVNPAGTFPIVDEPITLTVFLAYDGANDTYEGNAFIKMLEEKTNIHLDAMLVPSDADTRKDLILAGNDYPGVFWGAYFSNSDIMQYGVKDKMFIPITDYIEEYGYYFKKILEEKPLIKANLIAPDGEIYGVPRTSEAYHTQSPKLWFNYTWLNTLNLDEPKTTDDLFNVLKSFKIDDPNGNGVADEIPLTGMIQTWAGEVEYYLMNSFIYTDSNHFLYKDNGKVTFIGNKEAFKEGLKYIKMLYDEGLLDPAAFTQKSEQVKTLTSQKPLIVGAYAAGHMTIGIDGSYELMEAYSALPTVAGPEGIQYTTYTPMSDSISGAQYVITDKCEYPEAAYRMVDYFMSEEASIAMMYGVEGENWNYATSDQKSVSGAAGKYVIISPQNEQEVQARGLNRFWAPPFADTFELRDASAVMISDDLNDIQNYEARLYTETLKISKYWPSLDMLLPSSFFIESDLKDEFADLKTNIVDYTKQSMVQFILGEKDIDADWDSYVSDIERYGLDRYIEIYQQIADSRE